MFNRRPGVSAGTGRAGYPPSSRPVPNKITPPSHSGLWWRGRLIVSTPDRIPIGLKILLASQEVKDLGLSCDLAVPPGMAMGSITIRSPVGTRPGHDRYVFIVGKPPFILEGTNSIRYHQRGTSPSSFGDGEGVEYLFNPSVVIRPGPDHHCISPHPPMGVRREGRTLFDLSVTGR